MANAEPLRIVVKIIEKAGDGQWQLRLSCGHVVIQMKRSDRPKKAHCAECYRQNKFIHD